LGGLSVTPEGYAYMTLRLQELAKGRVIMVLEGGYNLAATSNSAEATLRALMKQPLPYEISRLKFTQQNLKERC
jgi:acetoin utilization deacetylase AcuC-like enzyme